MAKLLTLTKQQFLSSDYMEPIGSSFFTFFTRGPMKKLTEPPDYTIEKSRYGLYTSITTDGVRMVTGPSEDATRWVTNEIHIPVLMGTFDGYTSIARTSQVAGKL